MKTGGPVTLEKDPLELKTGHLPHRTCHMLLDQTALWKLWDASDHGNYTQMGSEQILGHLGDGGGGGWLIRGACVFIKPCFFA